MHLRRDVAVPDDDELRVGEVDRAQERCDDQTGEVAVGARVGALRREQSGERERRGDLLDPEAEAETGRGRAGPQGQHPVGRNEAHQDQMRHQPERRRQRRAPGTRPRQHAPHDQRQ